MNIYILDDLFIDSTTKYTGEEIIVYPVKFNVLEINKLKKLGINYTTDPKMVSNWIIHYEYTTGRDFGGIVVMDSKYSIKLNIDWDNLKRLKEENENNKIHLK